jgi:hypothetical protein
MATGIIPHQFLFLVLMGARLINQPQFVKFPKVEIKTNKNL